MSKIQFIITFFLALVFSFSLNAQVFIGEGLYIGKDSKMFIKSENIKVESNINGEGEIVVTENKSNIEIKKEVTNLVTIKNKSNEIILDDSNLKDEKLLIAVSQDYQNNNINTSQYCSINHNSSPIFEDFNKSSLLVKNSTIEVLKRKSKLKTLIVKTIIKENKESSTGSNISNHFIFKYINQEISHTLFLLAFNSQEIHEFHYSKVYSFSRMNDIFHPPINLV